jgi:Predicted membrane protein (DUF2079)
VPVGTAVVGAVLFAGVSVYRHDRFASGGFDLGIFDQTIWGYSRFQVVANTIKGTPDLLGDHFHPILVLLAPAYWVWNDARVLLVALADELGDQLLCALEASRLLPCRLSAYLRIVRVASGWWRPRRF